MAGADRVKEALDVANWRAVSSSNVRRVGWIHSRVTQPVGFVEFLDGSTYAYFGVAYQRMVAAAYAESVGRYLNRRVFRDFPALRLR
jgi:hypothetical protein